MSFRLLNERNHIVLFETLEVREIEVNERIHFAFDGQTIMCIVCGLSPTVWTDDSELWQRSIMRCL